MRALVLFLFFALATPAAASPVVADISTYRIAIDANFTGMRLFLFGARGATGDVVAVIRGPAVDFTVRRKEPVAGVWVNRRQMTFHGVPDFYAVAATRPLPELLDVPGGEALRHELNLGDDVLLPAPAGEHNAQRVAEFSQALLDYEHKRGLYSALPLSFMGETLFKTVIPFPDTIPGGTYTAEIYLISDGALAGMQTLPVTVEKTGFDAAVYGLAHHYPLLYGLIAIALALCAGWAADRAFGRS